MAGEVARPPRNHGVMTTFIEVVDVHRLRHRRVGVGDLEFVGDEVAERKAVLEFLEELQARHVAGRTDGCTCRSAAPAGRRCGAD